MKSVKRVAPLQIEPYTTTGSVTVSSLMCCQRGRDSNSDTRYEPYLSCPTPFQRHEKLSIDVDSVPLSSSPKLDVHRFLYPKYKDCFLHYISLLNQALNKIFYLDLLLKGSTSERIYFCTYCQLFDNMINALSFVNHFG